MNISGKNISDFIKREKLYVFLLVFVIFIYLSFSLLNQFLEDTGLGKALEGESISSEELISDAKIEEAFKSKPILSTICTLLFLLFVFFMILGLILDIIYLCLRHKKRIPIRKTQNVRIGRWNFWDVCKVAIIFLFLQSIILLLDIFLFSKVPYFVTRASLKLTILTTLVDMGAIAAIFYFVVGDGQEKIASLGLTAKQLFRNVKYGILGYIGLVPVLGVVIFLVGVLFKKFNIPIEPQPFLTMFCGEKHTPSLMYMAFFTALLGPVFEEIFFRGFVYNVFKKKLGIFGGIFLTSMFFAYLHGNLAAFFPIFFLGLLLTYIYEKTGSLVSSITVHVIHNSVTLSFLFFLKGAVS